MVKYYSEVIITGSSNSLSIAFPRNVFSSINPEPGRERTVFLRSIHAGFVLIALIISPLVTMPTSLSSLTTGTLLNRPLAIKSTTT